MTYIDFDTQRAAGLYEDGASIAQISKMFGCSKGTTRLRLKQAGVTMRPHPFHKPDPLHDAEGGGAFFTAGAMAESAVARRKGREAADRGDPISSYPPNAPLWFVAAWKTGWTERREAIREERDEQWRRAQNSLPPGGKRSTQIGQRMSRETARARLGEAFA